MLTTKIFKKDNLKKIVVLKATSFAVFSIFCIL
jgi:hypothetical protein